MLDETIMSSPEKKSNSIHKVREQRKKKRKHAVSSPLRYLYDETDSMEEQENIGAWNQQSEVDAFGDQLLLTQADRLDHTKAKERNAKFQPTQGFSKCENFLQPMDIKMQEIQKPAAKTDTMTKPGETRANMEISDSELVYFCEEVEKHISKPELEIRIKIENTPPKKETNSIVDSILKDFCSSPSSPDAQMHSLISPLQNEQPRTCNQRSVSMRLNFYGPDSARADEAAAVPSAALSSEDDSPTFLFNKTPLRTYARQCIASARHKFADQFKSTTFENDCFSDSSSVLSVQEDQTYESNALEVNRIHHSQQVCENIQNLSAFFTQNSQNSEDFIDKAVISMRKETESFNSINERMEQTFVAVNNMDRCSSLDANKSAATKSDDEINRIEPAIPKSCHTIENVELKDDILDESDNEWNGESDDIFKNFISQEAFLPNNPNENIEMPKEVNQQIKQGELLVMHQNNEKEYLKLHGDKKAGCLGFQTASRNIVSVSKEAEERATAIMFDLPQPLEFPKDKNKIFQDEEEVCNILQNHFANDDQCSGSSSKTKLQLGAEKLNESANLETEIKKDILVKKEDFAAESIENGEFLGFLTASKKSINISEAAKRRAASILTDLPEIPQKREKYQTPHVRSQENNLNNTHEKDAYKPSTSLSVEPKVNEINTSVIHSNVELNPESVTNKEFLGFLTASKKSIRISEAAKKRAASILTDLPEIPQKREKYQMPPLVSQENNLKSTTEKDAYKLSAELPVETTLSVTHTNAADFPDDIVLSEWPFEENSKMLEPVIKLESLHHQAHENTTTDTCSKKINKSNTENNRLQNSSMNGTVDDALRLTENNMSLVSPLSSRTTKRGASRKNLLSLSRSKKIKAETERALVSTRTNDVFDTPIKTKNFLANTTLSDPHQVPGTPNLKEFFSMATNTSTPARLNEINRSETMKANISDIEFNATSKALSTSKLSDTSCENITFQRLSMYDKSPAINDPSSSSSTISNCRVSGLRRRSCRNMKKQ